MVIIRSADKKWVNADQLPVLSSSVAASDADNDMPSRHDWSLAQLSSLSKLNIELKLGARGGVVVGSWDFSFCLQVKYINQLELLR